MGETPIESQPIEGEEEEEVFFSDEDSQENTQNVKNQKEKGALGDHNGKGKDKEEDKAEEEEEIEEILTEEALKERLEQANGEKEKGNKSFGSGEYLEAIGFYQAGLEVCPKKRPERAILHGNLAACYLKLEKYSEAIENCDKALEIDPQYLKILVRRAQAKEKKGGLDGLMEALEDYKKVLELDKNNTEAQKATKTLPGKIEVEKERQKKELIDKFKSLGNMFLGKFGLSTDNFNLQQDPATGSYSMNFNQNPGAK